MIDAYEVGYMRGMHIGVDRSTTYPTGKEYVSDKIQARDTYNVVVTLDRLYEDGVVVSSSVIIHKIY
jgi:hypothetical protein